MIFMGKPIKYAGNWLVRRANHVDGFYLESLDDGVKFGREPSDSRANEIAGITLIHSNELNNTVELNLSCGMEAIGLIKWCTIECFSVAPGYNMVDPFKVSASPNKNTVIINKTACYKTTLSEINKRIKIQTPFSFNDLVIRVKINFIDNVSSRLSDYISISKIRVCQSEDNFNSLICTHKEYEDIITPNVRLIINPSSHRLIISFTPVDFPPDKYNTLDLFHGMDCSRLFINDSNSQWYMNGIPKLGNSILELITSIKKIISQLHIVHVTTFGTSMGAYGAILIGCLVDARHIIAFNPELVLFTDNSRSNAFVKVKHENYNDLISFIEKNKNRMDLFFSVYDPIDLLMLKYSKKIKNDNLYRYEMMSHHNIGEHISIDYYWLSSLIEHACCDTSILPEIISPASLCD